MDAARARSPEVLAARVGHTATVRRDLPAFSSFSRMVNPVDDLGEPGGFSCSGRVANLSLDLTEEDSWDLGCFVVYSGGVRR